MRLTMSAFVAGLAFTFSCPSLSFAQYVRTDLVTDSGEGGTVQDPHLVNAWGLVSTATSPFWVSDNATGFSTLYSISNAGGVVSATIVKALVVTIPSASGAAGSPTGIVAPETPKGGTDFAINGKPAIFIFATLDGTISAFTGAPTAMIAVPPSKVGAATYTGLAIATNNGQKMLYAADGGPNRRIDVFDSAFQAADLGPDAFVDPNIPSKFAPYGIQTITTADGSQTIWVTYTALDKAQSGFVDAFTPGGVLLSHLELNGPLHSPWGVAFAPANFGPMSNALLIANNISRGRIDAFDPMTGTFLGVLRDTGGNAIEIDGVWAIQFGQGGANGEPNQLFFTAGNNNYGSGTFGVITVGR